MLLEPAKNVEVTIVPPTKGRQKLTFNNNLKVSEMLQALHEKKILLKPVKDYIAMQGEIELDADLPIHMYNIEKEAVQIRSATFGVHIVDEFNALLYITVNTKTDTVLDVKKLIANIPVNHPNNPNVKAYDNVSQMRLYIQNGDTYNLLSDECKMKNSGAQNNTRLYLVYHVWEPKGVGFYRVRQVPQQVISRNRAGQGEELDIVWEKHTVLSLALRLQEQFDIPVQNIQIYRYACKGREMRYSYELCQLDYVFWYIPNDRSPICCRFT